MNRKSVITLFIAMTLLLAIGAMAAIKQSNAPPGQHQIDITKETAVASAASGQNLAVEFEKDKPAPALAHR